MTKADDTAWGMSDAARNLGVMSALPVTTITLNNDELYEAIGAYVSGQISAPVMQAYLNACSASLPDMGTLIAKLNGATDGRDALYSYVRTHYPPG